MESELSWDRENYIFQKVTKMLYIIGQKIDCNGVGALRSQRHMPSKRQPKYNFPPPPPGGAVKVMLPLYILQDEFNNAKLIVRIRSYR